MRWAFIQGTLWLGTLALAGCFDPPPIEERWTRLDLRTTEWIRSESGAPALHLRGDVTYRSILTGTVAIELRRSEAFGPDALHFESDDDRLLMAADVARLFEASTPIAGDARLVTGWDHLIQSFDFTLTPATAGADSSGFFAVFYLGDGERVERAGAEDTLVVEPWSAEEHQVLPAARWIER